MNSHSTAHSLLLWLYCGIFLKRIFIPFLFQLCAILFQWLLDRWYNRSRSWRYEQNYKEEKTMHCCRLFYFCLFWLRECRKFGRYRGCSLKTDRKLEEKARQLARFDNGFGCPRSFSKNKNSFAFLLVSRKTTIKKAQQLNCLKHTFNFLS